MYKGERFLFIYGHDGRLTFIFLGGKRKKRGQKKNTKVFKNLHISKKSSTFAVAFGNRCALVHTAPLNERATDASAFPIANSLKASVYAGDPPCKEGDKSSTLVFLHSRVLFHRLRCDGRRCLHRVLFLHVGSSGADRPPRFARRDAHARCDDCHHNHNLFHNRLVFKLV